MVNDNRLIDVLLDKGKGLSQIEPQREPQGYQYGTKWNRSWIK